MKALTAAEMREVDRLTTERHEITGTTLMEHAGKAVSEFVLHEIALRFKYPFRKTVVLCGKGNNGGDGFVAARYLRQEIRNTVVVLFGSFSELRGDPALNFKRWREEDGESLAVESSVLSIPFEKLSCFAGREITVATDLSRHATCDRKFVIRSSFFLVRSQNFAAIQH